MSRFLLIPAAALIAVGCGPSVDPVIRNDGKTLNAVLGDLSGGSKDERRQAAATLSDAPWTDPKAFASLNGGNSAVAAVVGDADGLAKIRDGRVVPALVRALEDSESPVRTYASLALAKCGKTAVPPLRDKLKSPQVLVRIAAAAALVRIDPDDTSVIPNLLEAHEDVPPQQHSKIRSELYLRTVAQNALVAMGAKALPQLSESAEKGDVHVRGEAVEALVKIGETYPDTRSQVAKVMRGRLKDEAEPIRHIAANFLKGVGEKVGSVEKR
jgi:HEAT repeat protein